MRLRRPCVAVAIAALTTLGGAAVTSAHALVDPTTLTPPLRPLRVCYEDGPWVKCDASDAAESHANLEIADFDLPCGTIYESATVRTQPPGGMRTSCSSSETPRSTSPAVGASHRRSRPDRQFAGDDNWHETFLVPGDLSSDSEVSHGSFLRVPALGGVGFHESGIGMRDGTQHGHLDSFTDKAKARLCDLLTS